MLLSWEGKVSILQKFVIPTISDALFRLNTVLRNYSGAISIKKKADKQGGKSEG